MSRCHSVAVIALALSISLSLGGCAPGCDDPLLLETGTFRSVTVYQFSGVQPKSTFPHMRGKSLRMTVYRDLQKVTFEYVRDGKTVEESWDCVDRKVINMSKSGQAAGAPPSTATTDSEGGEG